MIFRMTRRIEKLFTVKETLEGAGVHLHRGFGYSELPLFDPFLLFDDFSSRQPSDYLPGFPLHPHRGIETVTYILNGDVIHKDSMGNTGTISKGDIQWMTAGSGIVHEEMPHGNEGLIGFQLWVNLPSEHKMMSPRYQEIKATEIPTISQDGINLHVIAGSFAGTKGPIEDIMANPNYFDIKLSPRAHITIPVKDGDTCFIYLFEGSITTDSSTHDKGKILLYESAGNEIIVATGETGARFLFVSGTPLNEPIAWHGPIVMNTDEEISVALYDLRNGTFIK